MTYRIYRTYLTYALKMHCPNCGKPATVDQQFCRSCGMALDSVIKLVAQHSSLVAPSQTKIEKAKLEQEIVVRMFRQIMIGMVILGLGLLMLVLNKNFDFGKMFGLVSSFFLLGGTGFAAFGVLNAIRQGATISGMPSREILSEANEKQLPTNPIPAALPSVTEDTTQLLSPDSADSADLSRER
jgi:zinc-ribbon domain